MAETGTAAPVDMEERLVGAWALITGAGDKDFGAAHGWMRDVLSAEVEEILARRPDLADLLDPGVIDGSPGLGDRIRVTRAGTVVDIRASDGVACVRADDGGIFYYDPASDEAETAILGHCVREGCDHRMHGLTKCLHQR